MAKSATQKTGVPVEQSGADDVALDESVNVKDPRLAAMDAISNNLRAEREKELGITLTDPDDAGAAELKAEEEAAETEKARKKADEAPEDKSGKEDDQITKQAALDGRIVLDGDLSKHFIKAKIDGKDVEINLGDYTRVIQKDSAASKRMEEANAAKREANEILAKAKAGGDKTEIKEAEHHVAATETDAEAEIKAAMDAMFAGDIEVATKAFAKVIGKGRVETVATPNADEITSMVVQKVEQNRALTAFADAYPEIVQNEHLGAMTDTKVKANMETGMQFDKALMQAGEDVRADIRQLATTLGMAEETKKTAGADRLNRKAEIDEVKSTGAKADTKTPEPETASGVISEMAAARQKGRAT